jgi:hypothetical protein
VRPAFALLLALGTGLCLRVAAQPDPANGAAVPQADIIEIKPLEVEPPSRHWPRGAALVAVIAAGAGAVALLLRRQRPGPPASAEHGRTPGLALRLALDGLAQRPELSDAMFYRELTAALRAYLDSRHGLGSLTSAAEEFLPRLAQLPLPAPRRFALHDLFAAADPVKFGGVPAGEARRGADLLVAADLLAADAGPAGEGRRGD